MQQISTRSRTARPSIIVQVITGEISGITHDRSGHYPSAFRVCVFFFFFLSPQRTGLISED